MSVKYYSTEIDKEHNSKNLNQQQNDSSKRKLIALLNFHLLDHLQFVFSNLQHIVDFLPQNL